MFGWTGKILHVNLTSGMVKREPTDRKMAEKYIGGLILADYLYRRQNPTNASLLSEDNAIIFTTGPLTGTLAPYGNRFHVATSGTMENGLTVASLGGQWGSELKYAGYDAMIIEGKAAKPVYLWLDNKRAELRDAGHLWGKGTRQTTDELRRETDMKAKVACIGPAGEKLLESAVVVSDYSFAAGRGGVGAVMGSKNLKAVAVRGTCGIRVAERERFLATVMPLIKKASVTVINGEARELKGKAAILTISVPDVAEVEAKGGYSVKPEVMVGLGRGVVRANGCLGCSAGFTSEIFRSLWGQEAESRVLACQGENVVDRETGRKVRSLRIDEPWDDAGVVLTEWANHNNGLQETAADATILPNRSGCNVCGHAIFPVINNITPHFRAVKTVLECVGLCPLAVLTVSLDEVATMLSAVTGISFSADGLLQTAIRGGL